VCVCVCVSQCGCYYFNAFVSWVSVSSTRHFICMSAEVFRSVVQKPVIAQISAPTDRSGKRKRSRFSRYDFFIVVFWIPFI